MTSDRWLEFHDSTVVSVQCDAMRAVIELDGYFHRWEGTGSARRGSGWTQQVRLELDFPTVEGEFSTLPARLADGRVVSKKFRDDEGSLTLPISIHRATVLELVGASGERLKVSAKRLRGQTIGKPRYVEALPSDMDPERGAG